MGTYTPWGHLYMPTVGEVGWGELVNLWAEALGVRKGNFIHMKDFCAGDGVTDDTDNIMEAFQAVQYYEIAPLTGFDPAPNSILGGIGGVVFVDPGVYLTTKAIVPDFRGATDIGHGAKKAIIIIGAGMQTSTFKYVGDPGAPIMVLGANGTAITDLDAQLGVDPLNAGASDNVGIITDVGFNGGLEAITSNTYDNATELAEDALVLLETSSFTVQRVSIGNVRRHGIYSINDPLSGDDYGSIGLTIQNCVLSGQFGKTWGKGIWCKDPHALRILYNESGGQTMSGDITVGGGGGNGHLIQGNSFEGLGELGGADWDYTSADFTHFPNSYGGVRPGTGAPMFPAPWDTESLGNHAVHIRTNTDVQYLANAHEDTVSSADPLVPLNANARMVFIEDTGSVHIQGNDIRCGSDYAIEVYGTADDIHITQNYAVFGSVASVDTRTSTVSNPFIYESQNGLFAVNYSEPTQAKIKHGPSSRWFGFSPRMIVGDYMAETRLDPIAGAGPRTDGSSSHFRGVLDVRGQIVSDGGINTSIVAGRAPVDGDFDYPMDALISIRGKIAQPQVVRDGNYSTPGSLANGHYFYLWNYLTATGHTEANTLAAIGYEVLDTPTDGAVRLLLPAWPPGTTGLEIWRLRTDLEGGTVDRLLDTITDTSATDYIDDTIQQEDLISGGARTDLPTTNTSDDRDLFYVRTGGAFKFVDLDSARKLTGTTTWDPGSLATGATASTTVSVTGAAVGDAVSVGFSTAVPAGLLLTGAVTASGTVTVTLMNGGGTNPTDLASGTVRVEVTHR